MTGSNKRTFADWLDQVSAFLETINGTTTRDVPNVPYRTWYDQGMAPGRAALNVARKTGYHGN